MLDVLFRSLRGFVRDFACATPDGTALQSGGITAGIVPASPERSFVNSVVYEDAAELERRLPELASAYDEAGVEAWTVWVRGGDPAAIRPLEAAGHALDGEPMAMARLLEGIEPPGDGLDFVRDPAPNDLAAVLAESYDWENAPRVLTGTYDGFHPYVALLDGRPVCSVAVHDQDGDAHVTLVGTVESARGRGLAPNLMRRALVDARERGCTTTTLVATKMGQPVYERLGYAELGRVQMWERRKPDRSAA